MITFDEPSHINSNTLKYMTFNQMWAFVCAPVSLWLSHSERHELDITPLKEQGMHWLPPNVMDLLFIIPLHLSPVSLPLSSTSCVILIPSQLPSPRRCRWKPQKSRLLSTIHSPRPWTSLFMQAWQGGGQGEMADRQGGAFILSVRQTNKQDAGKKTGDKNEKIKGGTAQNRQAKTGRIKGRTMYNMQAQSSGRGNR